MSLFARVKLNLGYFSFVIGQNNRVEHESIDSWIIAIDMFDHSVDFKSRLHCNVLHLDHARKSRTYTQCGGHYCQTAFV